MSDAEIVKACYQAMAARDFDALFQLVDETCVHHPGRTAPVGRPPRGPRGVAAFGLTLTFTIDSKVTHEMHLRGRRRRHPGRPDEGDGRRHRRGVRHPRGPPLDDPKRQGGRRTLLDRHPGMLDASPSRTDLGHVTRSSTRAPSHRSLNRSRSSPPGRRPPRGCRPSPGPGGPRGRRRHGTRSSTARPPRRPSCPPARPPRSSRSAASRTRSTAATAPASSATRPRRTGSTPRGASCSGSSTHQPSPPRWSPPARRWASSAPREPWCSPARAVGRLRRRPAPGRGRRVARRQPDVGLGLSGFYLGRQNDTHSFGGSDALILSRPFFDTVSRRENVRVVAAPGTRRRRGRGRSLGPALGGRRHPVLAGRQRRVGGGGRAHRVQVPAIPGGAERLRRQHDPGRRDVGVQRVRRGGARRPRRPGPVRREEQFYGGQIGAKSSFGGGTGDGSATSPGRSASAACTRSSTWTGDHPGQRRAVRESADTAGVGSSPTGPTRRPAVRHPVRSGAGRDSKSGTSSRPGINVFGGYTVHVRQQRGPPATRSTGPSR